MNKLTWFLFPLVLLALLGACVAVPQQEELASAAGGSLTAVSAAFGGGFGSTGCTIASDGNLSCNGNAIFGGTGLITGTTTLNGQVAVGDGGDTVAINSSDWDISATGAVTGLGAITADGDLTLTTDTTGGNAGAKTEFIGLPRVKLVSLAAGTNGSTETTLYIPAADPATSWVAISTTVTSSNDTSIRRVGVNSLKLAFSATAVNDNGAAIDITNDDLETANESIGFWIRSDTALDAGDLDLLIDDTDADATLDVCAVATVNVWQWCEVDISGLTGGNGNVVDKIGIVLKDAAGLGAFNIWLDGMYKWDADDEEALGVDIPYDGVLSVVAVVTAQDQVNTPADLAEHTAYFVNYQTSSDAIVWITDQSANSTVALVAYQ